MAINRLQLSVFVAGSILLAGCSSTQRATRRAFLDRHADALRQVEAAVVFDGCVILDRMGQDYVVRKESYETAFAAASVTSEVLVANGYRVSNAVIPFVCGSWPAAVPALPVLREKDFDGPPEVTALPLPLLEDIEDDEALADAYHALIRQVSDVLPWQWDWSRDKKGPDQPIDLSANQISRLRRHLAADYVWIVRTGGRYLSKGQKATWDAVDFVLHSDPYAFVRGRSHGFEVALVHLREGELIWSRRDEARGDPTRSRVYDTAWAEETLNPFLKVSRR